MTMQARSAMRLGVFVVALWAQFPPAASAAAGSGALSFLQLEAAPRQLSMGGVGVGLGADAYSLAYNPAWLSRLGSHEAGFSHARWLEGIRYQDLVYAAPTRYGGLGVRLQHLNYGDIQAYDDAGAAAGGLSAGDLLLGIGYAKAFADGRLSGGFAGKFAEERIGDARARTLLFDAGLAASPWEEGRLEPLTLGLAVTNLGQAVRFDRESEGVARAVSGGVGVKLLDDALAAGLDLRVLGGRSPTFHLGGEYWLRRELALRAGLEPQADQGFGLSAGLGFRIGQAEINYAFSPMGDLGLTHHVGMILRFGRPDDRLVQAGIRLMRAGKPAQAILKFDEALRLNPSHPEAASWLRRAHRRIRNAVREAR